MKAGPGKYCLVLSAFLLATACKKDPTSEEFIVRFWNLDLKASNMVPAVTGKGDHAVCLLYLSDNKDLYYDLYFDSLGPAELPGQIAIFAGSPTVNGTQILAFPNVNYTGVKSKGKLRLTQSQADSLSTLSTYLTVVSKSSPAGLVRGQLDKKIVFAADVALTGTTAAAGTAILRATEDNILHYNLKVTGVAGDDQLQAAHIHKGTEISLVLATVDTAYNRPMSATITAAYLTTLNNDALQVDVHSKNFVNGLLKGIIR